MSRIGNNWTTVVTPVIDVILDDTLEYTYSSFVAVGGFDWNLQVALSLPFFTIFNSPLSLILAWHICVHILYIVIIFLTIDLLVILNSEGYV